MTQDNIAEFKLHEKEFNDIDWEFLDEKADYFLGISKILKDLHDDIKKRPNDPELLTAIHFALHEFLFLFRLRKDIKDYTSHTGAIHAINKFHPAFAPSVKFLVSDILKGHGCLYKEDEEKLQQLAKEEKKAKNDALKRLVESLCEDE